MKSPDAKIIHADLEKHTNGQIKAEAPKPKVAEVIKDRILKTERLPISELVPFQGEAKKLSDKNFNKLRKSILDEGFSFTVHIWEHGGKKFIIDGHQRIHVMRQLEKQGYVLPEINCAFVSAKTFKQAKKLVMLAISQYGKLDREGFFDFVGDDDFDFDDFDFPDIDDDFFKIEMTDEEKAAEQEREDAVPEPPEEPITKPGDLWQLGDHFLLCGDSTNADQVNLILNNEDPLLMVTDPPYGVEYDAEWRDTGFDKRMAKSRTGKVSNDNRADWTETWELSRAQIAYVWYSTSFTDIVMNSLRNVGFEIKQQIIWNKSVLTVSRQPYHWKHEPCWFAIKKGKTANWQGDRKQTTVWDAASPTQIMSGSKEVRTPHPTQKPLVVYEIPIQNHTQKNDLIYEPFGGSGTAIIAAEKHNRRCATIELAPKYCDVIIKRWENYTGREAVRLRNIKKN